jgi:hypothetical protein
MLINIGETTNNCLSFKPGTHPVDLYGETSLQANEEGNSEHHAEHQ